MSRNLSGNTYQIDDIIISDSNLVTTNIKVSQMTEEFVFLKDLSVINLTYWIRVTIKCLLKQMFPLFGCISIYYVVEELFGLNFQFVSYFVSYFFSGSSICLAPSGKSFNFFLGLLHLMMVHPDSQWYSHVQSFTQLDWLIHT